MRCEMVNYLMSLQSSTSSKLTHNFFYPTINELILQSVREFDSIIARINFALFRIFENGSGGKMFRIMPDISMFPGGSITIDTISMHMNGVFLPFLFLVEPCFGAIVERWIWNWGTRTGASYALISGHRR